MLTALESALDAANELSATATALHRRRLGQYFTPLDVAEAMAAYIIPPEGNKELVKILDPCCGTGVLICSLSERLILKHSVTAIQITCFEKDETAAACAVQVLYGLQQQAVLYNCKVEYSVVTGDFIMLHHHLFSSPGSEPEMPEEQFDYIIANPPFYKPAPGDELTTVAGHVCLGQPNVYLMFLFAASRLLQYGGELVFLIPRSFSSGGQFAVFRERMLEQLQLGAIRLYAADTIAFGDDCKAFEQIIIHAIRRNIIPDVYQFGYQYFNDSQLHESMQHKLTYCKNSIALALPDNEQLVDLLLQNRTPFEILHGMQLKVATGNVMVSEAKQYRASSETPDALPVVWYSKKDNRIIAAEERTAITHLCRCEETVAMSIPAGNYAVLRRYSTGAAGNLLQAELLYREAFSQDRWLMDKKLMYITKANGMLSEPEAETIVQVLNSQAVQEYVHMLFGTINLQPWELQGLLDAPN